MLDVKDIISMLAIIIAGAAVWFKMNNRVTMTESSIKTIKRLILKDNGELGFTTVDQCREREKRMQESLRRSDVRYGSIEKELRGLSNNVLRIMIHLKINGGREDEQ